VGLDIAIDKLPCYRVHGDSTGAVDHAVADDGLGHDPGEGRRGFGREDGGFGSHYGRSVYLEGVQEQYSRGWRVLERRSLHFMAVVSCHARTLHSES
jgi:hypothetical protein